VGGFVISPRTNRVLLGVFFGALWTAGLLWRSPSIDARTVIVALIPGVIVGLLMYWLADKFRARP
jgi:hypothetical protein